MVTDAHIGSISVVGCVAIVLTWLAVQRALRAWLLASLPRVPSSKLTHEVLAAAAHEEWPNGLVRLPNEHGVLVTDANLAWRLLRCDDGSVRRDVSMYARYRGFLGGAIVLRVQATPHRQLRSALLPLFSVTATRQAHAALLGCTRRLLERLERHVATKGAASPAPLYRLLQECVRVGEPQAPHTS